jgi:uncharacterized membrane protein YccC
MLTTFFHEAFLIFFGTSSVAAAAAIAGADPRRVAPTVGALTSGCLTLASFVVEGKDAAAMSFAAGLSGIALSIALSAWMKWRSER